MSFRSLIQAFFTQDAARPFTSIGSGREVRLIGKHPVIQIDPEAMVTMHRYVDQCSTEVGWLGTAEKKQDGTIFIGHVFLFKQSVSGVTTKLSSEGLIEVSQKLLQQGEEGERLIENLRFWGHSHVNMACSPSGQDDLQMDDFKENGAPFFVRGIFNKNGDVRFDVYDFARGIILVDCKWEVLSDPNDNYFTKIDEEIREKVKTQGFLTTSGGTGGKRK